MVSCTIADRSFGGEKMSEIVINNSATKTDPDPRGKVFVTSSHGGLFVGFLAAKFGVRAGVFNDAGICKDCSAIAGLDYLEKVGIAAVTVDSNSAMIGNGRDVYENGIVSFVNAPAAKVGCVKGMKCSDAVKLLKNAPLIEVEAPSFRETRTEIFSDYPRVVCIDSASLVSPDDHDAIVVTGSHGGLLGGEKKTALKYDAIAAFYNDAGMGKNNAGVSRLPALDERGIIGGTVSSMSAKIGDGLSTYEDGVLSCVNRKAEEFGGKTGMKLKDFIVLIRLRLKAQAAHVN